LQWLAVQSGISEAVHGEQLNCCIFVYIKLLLYLKLNLWIMKKRVRFCNWSINHVHDRLPDPKLTSLQMRLILISQDALTHRKRDIGVVKILMP
jgi:hypothetical protein